MSRSAPADLAWRHAGSSLAQNTSVLEPKRCSGRSAGRTGERLGPQERGDGSGVPPCQHLDHGSGAVVERGDGSGVPRNCQFMFVSPPPGRTQASPGVAEHRPADDSGQLRADGRHFGPRKRPLASSTGEMQTIVVSNVRPTRRSQDTLTRPPRTQALGIDLGQVVGGCRRKQSPAHHVGSEPRQGWPSGKPTRGSSARAR